MTLVGAFVGGVLTLRFGVLRILFLGAVLSAVSNLLFAWLANQGHDLQGLIWVISDFMAASVSMAASMSEIAFLGSLDGLGIIIYFV
jgi:PAT family beta-lactamase induction signal transducer AmpG